MIDHRAILRRTSQVAWQPVIVLSVDKQRHLTIQQIGNVGDGVFHGVHDECDMAAVKMAAMQHEFMIRINNRIVIRAVEFRLDLTTKIGQCIIKHTDDMRRAANRIAVLKSQWITRHLLVLEVASNPVSDL